MKARVEHDGNEPSEARDLAEFEAELRRVLEGRLLESAKTPSEPSPGEARQLARMVAYMEDSDLARRPRALRPVPEAREAAHAASTRGQASGVLAPGVLGHGAFGNVAARQGAAGHGRRTFAALIAAARARLDQRRTLLRQVGAFAALALGVVLARGLVPRPNGETAPSVDRSAHVSSTDGLRPADDVYLGADAAPGAASSAFVGRLTWDPRGQLGVVRVAVFDRDGDPLRAVSEDFVAGSQWTPTGPLPKRFRVVVDRPADDGVSREELHCADYFVP